MKESPPTVYWKQLGLALLLLVVGMAFLGTWLLGNGGTVLLIVALVAILGGVIGVGLAEASRDT